MKKGKMWLAIVLAVVIMGTIAVGVAVADNATTTGQSPQNPYQTFLSDLASKLGITQTQLTSGHRQSAPIR